MTTEDTLKILNRLDEIQSRMDKIRDEAPALAKALDDAKSSGDNARAMFCQIAMVSQLNEVEELGQEINTIRKSLGLL